MIASLILLHIKFILTVKGNLNNKLKCYSMKTNTISQQSQDLFSEKYTPIRSNDGKILALLNNHNYFSVLNIIIFENKLRVVYVIDKIYIDINYASIKSIKYLVNCIQSSNLGQ